MGMGFLGPNSIGSVYGPSGFYILLPSLVGAREASGELRSAAAAGVLTW